MLYYVEGRVAVLEANLAVIDCGGVAYACNTTNNTMKRLKVGERARLYTYLNVREDAVDLFGFYTQAELNHFKLLIGVSGVGPKAALSILSVVSPDRFALAVMTGDEKALTAAPGIGKKIAQRIILELKDKLAADGAEDSFVPELAVGAGAGKWKEASSALAVLGYSAADISLALKGIDVENLALEEIIRQALKNAIK